jgi:hypothetical protein
MLKTRRRGCGRVAEEPRPIHAERATVDAGQDHEGRHLRPGFRTLNIPQFSTCLSPFPLHYLLFSARCPGTDPSIASHTHRFGPTFVFTGRDRTCRFVAAFLIQLAASIGRVAEGADEQRNVIVFPWILDLKHNLVADQAAGSAPWRPTHLDHRIEALSSRGCKVRFRVENELVRIPSFGLDIQPQPHLTSTTVVCAPLLASAGGRGRTDVVPTSLCETWHAVCRPHLRRWCRDGP